MSWVRHLLIFVSNLSIKLRLWGVLMARPTKYVTVVGSVGPQSVGEEEKEGGLTTEAQTVREYVMEKKMRVGNDAGEEDFTTDSQIHPVYLMELLSRWLDNSPTKKG